MHTTRVASMATTSSQYAFHVLNTSYAQSIHTYWLVHIRSRQQATVCIQAMLACQQSWQDLCRLVFFEQDSSTWELGGVVLARTLFIFQKGFSDESRSSGSQRAVGRSIVLSRININNIYYIIIFRLVCSPLRLPQAAINRQPSTRTAAPPRRARLPRLVRPLPCV